MLVRNVPYEIVWLLQAEGPLHPRLFDQILQWIWSLPVPSQ
jgi:hypothetical protein